MADDFSNDTGTSGFVPANWFAFGEIELADDQARLGSNIWPLDNLGLEMALDLRDRDDRSSGNDLASIADHGLRGELTWVSSWQVVGKLGGEYVGERYDDSANLAELDSYWTVDAALRWESCHRRWLIETRLKDLFDEESIVTREAPAPGRSAYLRVEYRF